MSDALYSELAVRFLREKLLELCLAVALAAMVNRVHATFRTDLDDGTRVAAGDAPSCPIGRRKKR